MIRHMLLTVLLLFGLATVAHAGASTGDITIDSNVGDVTTIASGSNVDAETNVHSVIVKDGAAAGDIVIIGNTGDVTHVVTGSNKESQHNVGSVIVKGN